MNSPYFFREFKSRIGTPAGASVSVDVAALSTTLGAGTDAAIAAGSAGSVHAHVRSAQTELANATYGLSALKTETDNIDTTLGAGADVAVAAGSAGSVHAHIRHAQAELANATYGLSALKTETDNIDTTLGAGTDAAVAAGSAGSVHAHVRHVQGEIASATYGLSALKTETDNIDTTLGAGTDAAVAGGSAGSIHAHVRHAQTELANATYGLSALKTETDNIDTTLGAGTDAAVGAGLAGSVHAHLRSIQDSVATITSEATQSALLDLYPWPSTTNVLNADPAAFYQTTGTTQSTTYVEVIGYTVTSGESGAKTLVSCFLDLTWRGQLDAGAGNSKWTSTTGSAYASGTALDLTDEMAESTTLTARSRSGAMKTTQMSTLPFRLSLLGKVGVGTNTLTLAISSDTRIVIAYQT